MWEESFFQLIHTLTDLFGNSIPTILVCVAVVGQIKCKSFIIEPQLCQIVLGKGRIKTGLTSFDDFSGSKLREQ